MKNITVTLDEKTAAWARVYAAKRGMSLSRFLGEVLHTRMRESREYDRAMRRFFEHQATAISTPGEPYPTRDEVHDRAKLR